MKAFTIKVGDKFLDYRLGHKINIASFGKELKGKGYGIEKLQMEGRHVIGTLGRSNKKFFVKLATSEGMSWLTQNEFEWNNQFNKQNSRKNSNFWVPINYDSGYFQKYLFYAIYDFVEGEKITEYGSSNQILLKETIEEIINFSELIQNLDIKNLAPNELSHGLSHWEWFVEKARLWLSDIPKDVVQQYQIRELLKVVENGARELEKRPRHGDLTPWHIFKLTNNKLYLFDAEHASSESVEYYDIAYYIQRVFSILENDKVANEILEKLEDRGYDMKKVKTILASRAIGGFLDRSLRKKPDYKRDQEFKKLILNL
ncbi:MAG: hypothetical protein HYW63_04510 [Candidatus Levybacteria bacterium]|nr:hypothetical protein [Candidatus Levybacteria bacterium]